MESSENNIPSFEPSIGAESGPQVTASSSVLSEHPVGDQVSIEVVNRADGTACDLWVVFKKPGRLAPAELLNAPDLDAMLTRAIEEGVDTSDACILLSDTSREIPCRVLLCDFPEGEFREKVIWDQEICNRISGLKIQSLGIYFSYAAFGGDTAPHERWVKASSREFLINFTASAVEFSNIKSFKVYVGQDSYNDILNSMLMLKQDLESKDTSVAVIH